jgi:hypothetical protein
MRFRAILLDSVHEVVDWNSNLMEIVMNKLIIAIGVVGLALGVSHARAGTPMMDDPILLEARAITGNLAAS